jgi:nucleoside-diphosphate-sugar epimerase
MGRVLITGCNGFLGKNILEFIDQDTLLQFYTEAPDIDISSYEAKLELQQTDLLNKKAVNDLVSQDVDTVIHLGCRNAGIKYNIRHSAEVMNTISSIDANIINAAAKHQVKNFIYIGTLLAYPYIDDMPVKEESYTLHEPSRYYMYGYGSAKRFALSRLRVYAEEYGLRSHHPIFPNIFGIHDKFDYESARVIPTFIRKSIEGQPVTILGTGDTERDFMFSKVAAKYIWSLVNKIPPKDPELVNISYGHSIKIKNLLDFIGFEGEINYDMSSKPPVLSKYDMSYKDPTPVKVMNNTKICLTNPEFDVTREKFEKLFQGWINETTEWYLSRRV